MPQLKKCFICGFKKHPGTSKTLFGFPTDPERSKAWANALKCPEIDALTPQTRAKKISICEVHFDAKYVLRISPTCNRLSNRATPISVENVPVAFYKPRRALSPASVADCDIIDMQELSNVTPSKSSIMGTQRCFACSESTSGRRSMRFPMRNPDKLKRWLTALGITERKLPKDPRLCCYHFKGSDFLDPTRVSTSRLREDAIPFPNANLPSLRSGAEALPLILPRPSTSGSSAMEMTFSIRSTSMPSSNGKLTLKKSTVPKQLSSVDFSDIQLVEEGIISNTSDWCIISNTSDWSVEKKQDNFPRYMEGNGYTISPEMKLPSRLEHNYDPMVIDTQRGVLNQEESSDGFTRYCDIHDDVNMVVECGVKNDGTESGMCEDSEMMTETGICAKSGILEIYVTPEENWFTESLMSEERDILEVCVNPEDNWFTESVMSEERDMLEVCVSSENSDMQLKEFQVQPTLADNVSVDSDDPPCVVPRLIADVSAEVSRILAGLLLVIFSAGISLELNASDKI